MSADKVQTPEDKRPAAPDESAVRHGEPHPNTRPRTRTAAAILLAILLLFSLLFRPVRQCHRALFPGTSPEELAIEERVNKILSETPLIDGHNDFPLLIRYFYKNHIYNETFSKPFEQGGTPGHVDIPRLLAGKNGGAFWSVYWSCPENGTDLSDANYAEVVKATFQQIDVVTRLKKAYPEHFSPTVNGTTALAAFKKGQLISPLGIEGLHQIGNSVANLRLFYALGVRYATLNHNCPNQFADAALWEHPMRKAPSYWGGLSPKGRQLVREMNRIGMIVDLSHTSEETMVDVLGGGDSGEDGSWEGSRAPVIFSHSSAYSLCPHPRNVPDSVLRLVKSRNSLVMVNFAPDFVSCVPSENDNGIPDFYPPNSTLAHVADHVMHIGNLIGFDHVGFGSDFDGIPTTPEGLEDVSKYPDLVAELLRRGVSDEDAAKVVGGNLLRVWKEVDDVALEMQAEGVAPMEDDLPALAFEDL
ncbi:Dipeptidase [Pleurostoma richardsiae]|uniref:Dipeptidase n=1 Tax=Pleurostoma richardsiae TaxID=41990 RepID=A0AA38S0A3_9PEZI|nr:Dipeptidase [Pleurostoma richardsiae]